MSSSRSPSRGRAATIVTSTPAGRQPASARRATTVASSAPLVDAGGRRGPAGNRRPRSPRPAAPEERVGDRMERDVAVGVAVQPRGARRSRSRRARSGLARARTGGGPGRSRSVGRAGGVAEQPRRACEVRGDGHLEVARIARDDMDGDSTGLQQRGLVGPVSSRRPRRRGQRGAQQLPADALRRLRGAERGPVEGLADQVAGQPLDGLDDGHDRDRRPVARQPRPRRRRRAAVETSGRAPSCTSTTGRRPDRARAARARRTRLAPSPGVARRRSRPRRRRGGSHAAPADLARRSAAVTTTIGPTSRRRREGVERPGQERSARRAAPGSCRCRPSGSTTPAATTMTSADRAVMAAAAGSFPTPAIVDGSLTRAAAGRRSSARRPSGGPASPTRRGPGRCGGPRLRPRSSCRRRGSRRPGRPPCPPG